MRQLHARPRLAPDLGHATSDDFRSEAAVRLAMSRRSLARDAVLMEELVLDFLVNVHEPLLGTRGTLLEVPKVALHLPDLVLGGAQLHRELVRDVHGAVAVLARDIDGLLEHRDDGLA